MSGLLDPAIRANAAGLCVVRAREDGSKAPVGAWGRWQRERPDEGTLREWFADGRHTGFGFVTGAISGNLEALEFDDGGSRLDGFRATAHAVGLGELWERIEAGYLEATPSGGFHLLWRCSEIAGNTKLACRPKRPEEKRHERDDVAVLIETRGEGGYIVAAPSNGRVHPTGGAYRLLRGGVETIATISPDERRQLLALAETFGEMPDEPSHSRPTPTEQNDQTTKRASGATFDEDIIFGPVRDLHGSRTLIDDYNARATWAEILEPTGWSLVFDRGGVGYWRRPGKDRGWSATTNVGGSDRLCVFTSSSSFKPTTRQGSKAAYSKFAAYAHLHHGDDFMEAARDLGRRGYGEPTRIPTAGRPSASAEPDETVAPFPLEVLHERIRALIVQGAAALPCPPDFIAVPLLTGAGVAIGDALELELKPGWREGANIYTSEVGDPGSKKTPAQKLALGPLFRIQQQLRDEYAKAKAEYEAELAVWEAKKKGERGERPKPPRFFHVLTTDATIEAVAPMLLAGKGLLLWREELSAWVMSMNQYRSGGKGADRQHYLSMWSRTLIKVDRKGAPEPVIVVRPFFGVTGGIQPELVPELADPESREDGFIDRVLWSYPDPVPDTWSTDGVGRDAIAGHEEIMDRLYRLQGEPDPDGDGEELRPRVVRLSASAMTLWAGWYREHAAEMAGDEFSARLRGPWAKMPGQAARLALILHSIDAVAEGREPSASPVSEFTLAGALTLVDDYFKPHARRVYRLLARQRRDRVVTLIQALRERGPLLTRDIIHGVFKRNVSAAAVHALLDELRDAGLATSETRQGDVGRPGTWWSAA